MVCAVSFTRAGKLYYLDPGAHAPRVGDKVLVPTDAGPEVAECVWAAQWATDVPAGTLPVLAGIASDADLVRDGDARRVRATAKLAARRLARELALPLKIAGVDWRPGAAPGGAVTVYFTAEQRVDFRELVRDLGATLRSKVELRQLSARDQARITGGIGPCGRDLCCATFLTDFEPVTLRMARDQNLPLNPLRISGACGKLLCCLKYEHPLYLADAATGRGGGCAKAGSCGPRQEHDETYAAPADAPANRPVLRGGPGS